MNSPGKSKKDRKPSLQHVRLHHWMMNTAAWQSLDAIEQSFYVQIARRYNGTKVGRRAALRARAVLQDRGFIVATRTGAFGVKVRHSTEWRLTEFRCDVTGAPATTDFTRWQPKVIPLPVRRTGRKYG